jgi:hypothetical protein
MKKLIFFVFAGLIISACSNSGSRVQPVQEPGKNEVVITNDLENALAKIPSWKGDITVFDMKDIAHSGGFVCGTNDTLEFSYTYNEIFKNINDRLPKQVIFSGWVYTTVANPKFSIICGLNENGKQYDWNAFPLEKELTESGKWVEFNASFYLDKKPIKPEDDISLYAWNQSKKPVYIDDLKVTFLY